MRILTLDVETVPNLAWAWGIWQQDIPINMIEEPGEVLCFAAKWHDSKKVYFSRSPERFVDMWYLLDEADMVIHYNGKKFDIPHLNREFVLRKMLPPSPYKQVDLLSVVKKRFNFPSNKLQYVSTALGLEGKAETGGFELWKGCMSNDPKAWATMEKYNKQDVVLTEKLYDRLLPWIPTHPSHTIHELAFVCPTCGSAELTKRGFAYTTVSKYQQYQCRTCGAYSRDTSRVEGVPITGSAW